MKKSRMPLILKDRRSKLGLSPEQVVSSLHDRGFDISVKTLYAYEAGSISPKVSTFIELCDIYGINDVMGEFGYTHKICNQDSEWSIDQYNDFFNAPLLDKIYLLITDGVPSFSGYESKLASLFPTNSENANFNSLYSSFQELDEFSQGEVLKFVTRFKKTRFLPSGSTLSNDEQNLVELYRLAAEEDRAAVDIVLSKYKKARSEEQAG